MDIAALSSNLSQVHLRQAVGISVFKLAKEAAIQQNQDMVSALKVSNQPHLGKHIDLKV